MRIVRAQMNPNDEIRETILRYFYARNQNATSRFGKKGSAVKMSDVKKELKAEQGLKQQAVVSNLNYLLDRDWVEEIAETKQYTPRGGNMAVPSTTRYYQVTAKGIDRIEGGSSFEPRERYAGINVQATGQNVITLGDGNVVQTEFRQLHTELRDLKEAVTASSEISDAEKLDVSIDLETIMDQLARSNPDTTIIGRAWKRTVEALSAASGLSTLLEKVGPYVAPLLASVG
jgi:hypothetical protein